MEPKKRRIMKRDHDAIAAWVMEELGRRKQSQWRKRHEERWREVDRQIQMEPPQVVQEEGGEGSWHNAIQLGDLSDASETFTADVQRMAFPVDRKWFAPHVELDTTFDEGGNEQPVPPEEQKMVNGLLRSFMVQQHRDFGLKGRSKLAVKEIYHHGSVVAEITMERIEKYRSGGRVERLYAPLPTIHSMWNCYPDPSPVVHGTELFYRGGMCVVRFMPYRAVLDHPTWINKDRLEEKHKSKDPELPLEIVRYFGTVYLKRHDGILTFPNRITTVCDGAFLESVENKTPYSPIVYLGYERDDVRDPYYTSPLVKIAPMAKFTNHMANRTMDAVDLSVDPPITYDRVDTRGTVPVLFPGARIEARGQRSVAAMTGLGDPRTGLAATEFGKMQLAESTSVSQTRKGVGPATEQTATEILKTEQRAETRTVEFIGTYEHGFLVPYLHMQHDLNLLELKDTYPFFNDEIHTPDFLRVGKKDLPKQVIFEVVGSRQALGEEERTQRFLNTVSVVAGLEPLAQATNWQEIAQQLWEDSRVKDPERFLQQAGQQDSTALVQQALQEQQAQFEQQAQQMAQQMQQLQQQAQAGEQAKVEGQIAGKQHQAQQAQLQLQIKSLQEQIKLNAEKQQALDELTRLRDDIQARQEAVAQAPAEAQPAVAQAPAAAPAAINVNAGGTGGDKVVRLVRENGRIVGATVSTTEEVKLAGSESD